LGFDTLFLPANAEDTDLSPNSDGSYTLRDNSTVSLGNDSLRGIERIVFADKTVDLVTNLAPTDINLSSQTVKENASGGTVIGKLSAIDPDAGDTATFTLSNSAGGRFVVDNDLLKVAAGAIIDFETTPDLDVGITVTDGAGNVFSKTLTIDVTDIDESANGGQMSGTKSDDTLTGSTGNDSIRAKAGNDVINGGTGDDFITGDAGNDTITAGKGNDRVDAGADNDIVYGRAGDDILRGGSGSDRISGDIGSDRIYGDAGNDYLDGGQGFDVFVFTSGDGSDRISGFTIGEDLINVHATGLHFSDLTISALAGGTLVQYGGDELFLVGVSTVSSSDFVF